MNDTKDGVREVYVSSDNRVFPIINENDFIIEYKGKHPQNLVRFIEKSAYDKLLAERDIMREALELVIKSDDFGDFECSPQGNDVLNKARQALGSKVEGK